MKNGGRALKGSNGFKTVREQVVERLRARVMAGEYEPGVALREVELAEQFGVSRGPVRDALLQLSNEGLLVYRANSGVRVGEPPSDGTRGLIVRLRRELEVYAIREGWDQFTDEDRQVWGEALGQLRLACELGDVGGIVEADVRAHQAILESTRVDGLLGIWKQMCAGMRFVYTRLADHMQIYEEHRVIVDAYDGGDLEGMVKAIEDNIV